MSKPLPLTIKIRSLAEEAKIIWTYEQKLIGQARECDNLADKGSNRIAELRKHATVHRSEYLNIRNHRRVVVRNASRSTLLAYGYINGRRYREIEFWSRTEPNWTDVERMIRKYGKFDQATFDKWKDEPPLKQEGKKNGQGNHSISNQ